MAFAGAYVYRRRMSGVIAMLLLLLTAIGCGDGSSPVQPSSAVQVKVGDAPADRVVAFEMTLASLVLTTSNGQQVTILPSPRRVEFTRLAGTLEPVAALEIPQGTYTEAAVAASDLHISYIDATGDIHEYTSSAQISTHQTLAPQLVVGTSSVLDIDLNLAASITNIDPTNVEPPQFQPVYTFSVAAVTATKQTEEEGALEHVVGLVTAADSSSFTMLLGQNGVPLTFLVDVSTTFQDVTLTTLPNMIVEVDGVTGADGTLHAERVAGLTNTSGAVAEGMLIRNHMLPDAQAFTPRMAISPESELVVQDGVGNGMLNTLVGTPVTLDFTNASYGVNGEGMPDGWAFNLIGGLVFNAATMIPGQTVQVVTNTGITPVAGGHIIPARTVTLQEQAASGVVSDYRQVSVFLSVYTAKSVSPRSALSMPIGAFDLQLPEDSYLRLLTPFTSVTVGVFPETKVYGTSAISDLMNVRVRGWLFYFNDQLAMIADRIDYLNTVVPAAARKTVPRR